MWRHNDRGVPRRVWTYFRNAYGLVLASQYARRSDDGELLSRLFDAQRQRLAPAFAQGAAFIAQTNTRSLRAHTVKLGM